MKAKIIIECGNLDDDHNIIVVDGVNVPDKNIPVLRNFDASFKGLLGFAKVYKDGGVLMADIDLKEDVDGYPAIGVKVDASFDNGHGGATITKSKLYSIAISDLPNSDPSIKKISEQEAK